MKHDRFRLLHLDDTGNWGKLKARDRSICSNPQKCYEFRLQVVLSEGEVEGWVMLHHPDLGELIRTRHIGTVSNRQTASRSFASSLKCRFQDVLRRIRPSALQWKSLTGSSLPCRRCEDDDDRGGLLKPEELWRRVSNVLTRRAKGGDTRQALRSRILISWHFNVNKSLQCYSLKCRRSTMVEFSDRNMEDFATGFHQSFCVRSAGHIDATKPVNELPGCIVSTFRRSLPILAAAPRPTPLTSVNYFHWQLMMLCMRILMMPWCF